MGSQSSKELNEPLVGYKFPTDRVKMRQVRNYPTDSEAAQFDPCADKYDYLIIFKRPVDVGVGGGLGDAEAVKAQREAVGDEDRVSWNEIEQMWFQATPGDEDKKNAGVDWLRREWIARFRTDMVSTAQGGDRIPRAAFEGLVREHVCDVLVSRTGLQLKVSVAPGGREVYCLVRAPASLLERKAAQLGYKLKCRGEVDPGRDFWQKWADHDSDGRPVYVEIQEERALYEKNKANEILEDLYHAGKISANDMAVFDDDEPTREHWSRRVHTLERVADRVPVANRFPAYAEFSTNPKDRHLYDEYASVRGKTLFLAKDRLYLTKRLLDEAFDFGVLVENDVIVAMTALHDAAHGEVLNLAWFERNWVFQLWANNDAVGAPCVSQRAVEKGASAPMWLKPWSQPLMEIRQYYGEKIALYFAWVGFYGYSLITPAVAGLVVFAYQILAGVCNDDEGLRWDQICFSFFLVVWAAYYKECWDVESQYCAVKWGTADFEEEEVDRPQFVGDADCPRRQSPITNQKETFYPEEKRARTQCASFVVVLIWVAVCLALNLATFQLQYMIVEAGFVTYSKGVALLQALLIKVLSALYGRTAAWLNDGENHKTHTAFENNLIIKKLLFEVFNNYAALFITAFIKAIFFECTSQQGCLGDVQFLLQTIIATRFVVALLAAFSGRINQAANAISYAPKDRVEPEDKNPLRDEESELGDEEDDAPKSADKLRELEAPRYWTEVKLEIYDGTFDDYAEIVLQRGLVVLWSLGWTFLPLFAMVEVLFQIRVDAYKLAALTRRPDALPAETVGSWVVLTELIGLIGVYTNAGIIVYTTDALQGFTLTEKLLTFFIIEQVLLFAKVVTHLAVSDEPPELREIRMRQQHVVHRHKNAVFYGDFDDDDSKKGNVDRDALDANALGGVSKLGDRAVQQLEWLRRKLVLVETDIKISRQQYKLACRTEVFRDDVGVSYSRHTPDLALGMISLTVLEAEDVGDRRDPVDPKDCRLIVSVRDATPASERKYEGSAGPAPAISKPARRPAKEAGASSASVSDGSSMIFNQSFSLAPVKTIHAEIFIEIMDEARKKRCGSATIPLNDLANQKKQSLTLAISKPAAFGAAAPRPAVLYCKVQFQYSKILPIKHRIYMLLEEQRKMHRDVTNLQLGKECERAWDFPYEAKQPDAEAPQSANI
ncbi:calcium-activated chloride channel-domain-containing protein [Pelagophyceae sp. CCMP2097]|nr:calcium-activated chloride channel-domain-containing protein [Pelagophyceae sp. CCMP2097]|mmetsp:Transcript_22744/g.76888  ORF Transcript_22744/g.76888 Transcript_22744/m.76888 type:complete len:1174 (+) Transcript_22744:103-3624(+)